MFYSESSEGADACYLFTITFDSSETKEKNLTPQTQTTQPAQ